MDRQEGDTSNKQTMGEVVLMSVRKHTPKQHGSILILHPLPSRLKFGVHPARIPLRFSNRRNSKSARRTSKQQQSPSITAVLSLSALFTTTTTSILHVLYSPLSSALLLCLVLNLEACWLDDFPLTFHGFHSRRRFENSWLEKSLPYTSY